MRHLLILVVMLAWTALPAQEEHQDHGHEDPGSHMHHDPDGEDHSGEGLCHDHREFDPGATAFHHIADANIYSIGPFSFPLPCILYTEEDGWTIFSSGKFDIGHHGDGHYAINRFVLDGGSVKRVVSDDFPEGKVPVECFLHKVEKDVDGKDNDVSYVVYQGKPYKLDPKSTADGGLFGGGVTSFYDFSLTKNVVSMIIVFILLGWIFLYIARAYKKREGKAPKGVQSFIEPMFLFIQEEVCKPFLGDKYMRFQPFIMALFFFILGLNLIGQIPFLGGANVTGNLSVTLVLAVFAFVVTNLHGNKHYWQHIFWMPGVPAGVKTIVTPVEILGLFIKPLTLMLRLFANITAGHMVVIIFVSLIFVFGNVGENAAVSFGTAIGSTLLTLFIMAIELLVAFIQAFVFAILTASYIGAAIEEHH